jgi:hypothetical protein
MTTPPSTNDAPTLRDQEVDSDVTTLRSSEFPYHEQQAKPAGAAPHQRPLPDDQVRVVEAQRTSQNLDCWLTVSEAAKFLSLSEGALRKALERHATCAPDGGVEATLDGVRARKLGRRWRLHLEARWRLEFPRGNKR